MVGFPLGGTGLSISAGVTSRIELQHYAHGMCKLLALQIDGVCCLHAFFICLHFTHFVHSGHQQREQRWAGLQRRWGMCGHRLSNLLQGAWLLCCRPLLLCCTCRNVVCFH